MPIVSRARQQAVGGKVHVRMRMQDLGTRNPSIDQRPEPIPSHPVALASPPNCAVPAPDHLSPKAVRTKTYGNYQVIIHEAATIFGLDPQAEAAGCTITRYRKPKRKFRIISAVDTGGSRPCRNRLAGRPRTDHV